MYHTSFQKVPKILSTVTTVPIYFVLSMDQTMQMYDNFVGFPLL